MSPLEYYQQQLESGFIASDTQQNAVMNQLQQIYLKLVKHHTRAPLIKHLPRIFKPKRLVKGLYVWGSVGVGKTFMMDIFFHCLAIPKMRLHFHQFMQRTQNELSRLQGRKNPLDIFAKKLASESRVLCFDEFFVSNIADAMLLGNLLKALFSNDICLIASSNTAPDELYKHGIQRENFLPAIELLNNNTTVLHITSQHDYRREHTVQAGIYFTPLDTQAEQNMEKSFQYFSTRKPACIDDIELFDRPIKVRKRTVDTIWFDFIDLCGIPRSQSDFLIIARRFRTVLISNIPIIHYDQDNLITSFINLIDVFYDAHIKVVISAATDIESLYPNGRLRFDFARTQSRLIEMQSADYFTKAI